jgi:TorA maturation chaperone TorD
MPVLIPHDPIRETLHALTRSAVYGMFAGLLAPPPDALALANHFEQAFNLAGTVPARLPFSWGTATLMASIAVARDLDPAELLGRHRECFDADGEGPWLALDEGRVDGLAAQRIARTYERLGFGPAPALPADHLAQQLALLRQLAEREADAETAEARLEQRRLQVEFIDRHAGPRTEALAIAAAPKVGRNPFAGVLVALAQWVQRDRRWLGAAIAPKPAG